MPNGENSPNRGDPHADFHRADSRGSARGIIKTLDGSLLCGGGVFAIEHLPQVVGMPVGAVAFVWGAKVILEGAGETGSSLKAMVRATRQISREQREQKENK